jgi:fatty acid desaturase
MEGKARSKSPAVVALCFGLTNALMIMFLAALIAGGYFVAVALGITVLTCNIGDEVQDNDRSPPRAAHWFYEANLYATLPLIVLITIAFIHYFTPLDPLGLVSGLGALGIRFAAAPAWSSSGPVIAATLGVGIFYAIAAVTVGHELIHRRGSPIAIATGRALLAFTFNSSFSIFHIHIHHRHAGTLRDPVTARRGETFYAFALRSIIESPRQAFDHEARRLRRNGMSAWSWRNRMLRGEVGSLAILASIAAMAGVAGLACFVAASIIGELLFVAINYAQHYGLVRVEGGPFAPRHAWDCHRPVSNALHYNLPRHSDHHQNATKPFWQLDATADAPVLPYGYETMALIALVPPLWRRIVAPLLSDWDQRLANDAERRLVEERGWTIAPPSAQVSRMMRAGNRSLHPTVLPE